MKRLGVKHIPTHLSFNFIIEKINNLKNFSYFEMKMMIFWKLMIFIKITVMGFIKINEQQQFKSLILNVMNTVAKFFSIWLLE